MREEIIQHMKKTSPLQQQTIRFPLWHINSIAAYNCIRHMTGILEGRGGKDVVYCDFKMTFDKVPHQQLLKRVEAYGIY